MDFHFMVSTPKNTAKENAVSTKLKLTEGFIRRVWMWHPFGCRGYAYATVWEGGHQLYPHNAEEAYHGDGSPFDIEEDYYLEEPAELTLKTWNLSTLYSHNVFVRITVLRARADPLQQALIDLVAILKRLLGMG